MATRRNATKPQPTSLKLSKLVTNRLDSLRGKPRARTGFHPSELHRMCPVLHYFNNEARLGLAEADPRPHYEYLQRVMEAKADRWPGRLELEFEVGDAIHQMVQYHLGVNGVLWGRWMCVRCERKNVVGPSFMPRITIEGRGGQPVFDAAPCNRCKGTNRRERHPWVYLEPRVRAEAWGIENAMADGEIRMQRGDQVYHAVLEIKSINDWGWGGGGRTAWEASALELGWTPPPGWRQDEGHSHELPKKEHVTQASIYAWVMEIPRLYFVYVNKNQVSRWKEFMVPPDPIAIANAQHKMAAAGSATQQRVPPLGARICPDVRDQVAKKCPAVEKCFGCKPVASFWDKEADGVLAK